MSRRDDFLNALGGRPVARTPFQELEVSARHVATVLGRPAGGASTALPPEDYAEFTRLTGQCALYHNALWKAGRVYQPDSAGRMQYAGGRVRTRGDLSVIEPPPLEAACARIAALAESARRHGLAVIFSFPSPFRLALFAMGYETFALNWMDDPAFVKDVIAWFEAPARKALDALLALPVDAYLLAGSVCTGSGPIFSPALLRAVWLPSVRSFLQPIVRRGLPIVLHMDGDFSTITDLLLELPIAAIHPFEVAGGLSIYEFKQRYGGRVGVWGNVDLSSVLTRGAPDAVREDVREHLRRLAPGGRYILGSSHEIPDEVPPENFLALVRAAEEFGAVHRFISDDLGKG